MNLLKIATSLFICGCLLAFTPSVAGLGITVNYTDEQGPSPPAEGFWDPAVGAARRAAFEHAVSIWAAHLDGTIPLVIKAEFNDMGAGVLGSATRTAAWANLPGFPEAVWIFVAALASQLNDKDRSDPDGNHMFVQFNTDNEIGPSGFGKWYYGTDGLVPSGDFDFVTVALHEIGHGLGMIHQISPTTGRSCCPISHYISSFSPFAVGPRTCFSTT